MTLIEKLQENPYQGYAYSYPHKTSYRNFDKPVLLKDIWKQEDKGSLFLYVHIPFCEMRCGFCNLFTTANPKGNVTGEYLDSLQRQAIIMRNILADAQFTRIAVGGGTPTFLNLKELEQLFFIIENIMGAVPAQVPFSFEMSPKTVTTEKLQFLSHKGVDRVSIGIQSFLEAEVKALGRPQGNREVFQALEMIKSQHFPVTNIDLIYGSAGQTLESWLTTLEITMTYKPEEIYLYPLYVRPLTGLEKIGMSWDNFRLQLYRAGRDYLLNNGYQQVSMRMFSLKNTSTAYSTVYCCQEDSMVGLGVGARSYTKHVHYSAEYAVGRNGIKEIIQTYIHNSDADFEQATYGIYLNEEERKRRYVIKSLLHVEGLDLVRFKDIFLTHAFTDFPQLLELVELKLAYIHEEDRLLLTPAGLERSDTIGPALYSQSIQELMHQFELR